MSKALHKCKVALLELLFLAAGIVTKTEFSYKAADTAVTGVYTSLHLILKTALQSGLYLIDLSDDTP